MDKIYDIKLIDYSLHAVFVNVLLYAAISEPFDLVIIRWSSVFLILFIIGTLSWYEEV